MRRFAVVLVLVCGWACLATAQPGRFVVDDDAFSDRVVSAASRLLHQHKLQSMESLRAQVHNSAVLMNLLPVAHTKLEPPDLCDRLRESTLAVGTFYKCPDCGHWHFSSSTGFVVAESGLVCTCCHVVMESDDDVKESYLIAADASGHVFPVQAVLAADTDADTCWLRIGASGLKPLPLRPGVRPGETVYCLSHPGGYFFMFTQGLVARINRRTNADTDEAAQGAAPESRPVLLLNITAEFAPGSSGAPVVDSCGNVVGQVASIADAGEPASDGDNQPASPSVAVRFCTASEEILRLANPSLVRNLPSPRVHPVKKPKPRVRKLHATHRCPLAVGGPSGIPAGF